MAWAHMFKRKVRVSRFVGYPIICLIFFLSFTIYQLFEGEVWMDYHAFHAAGNLAKDGRLAEAYNIAAFTEQVHEQLSSTVTAIWSYPPTMMVLLEPFTWAPFSASAVLWMGFTLAFFLWAMAGFVRSRQEWLFIAAAPHCYNNFLIGQVGFLVAGLILLALQHRQVRAGLALALLTVKPQFGLLFPVLMLGYRRWTTIIVTISGTIGLIILSVLFYGLEPWRAFLSAGVSGAQLLVSSVFETSATPATTLVTLGIPKSIALGVHMLFVLFIAGVLMKLIRDKTPYRLVMAFTVTAALTVTPYNNFYDWILLMLPMLILWQEGKDKGFLPFEMPALIFLYFAPIIVLFGELPPLNLAIALGLMGLIFRRIQRQRSAEAEDRSQAQPA